jgi:hypothetical protein
MGAVFRVSGRRLTSPPAEPFLAAGLLGHFGKHLPPVSNPVLTSERTLMSPRRGGVNRRDDRFKIFLPKHLS